MAYKIWLTCLHIEFNKRVVDTKFQCARKGAKDDLQVVMVYDNPTSIQAYSVIAFAPGGRMIPEL